MFKEEFMMENGNNAKTAIFGWVVLAGAYLLGRKHGWTKYASEVKDVLLEQLINKEKEAKGS
jgi:hypothetical protein